MNNQIEFGKDLQPGTNNPSKIITDGVFVSPVTLSGRNSPATFSMVIDQGGIDEFHTSPDQLFENALTFIRTYNKQDLKLLLNEMSQQISEAFPGDLLSYSIAIIDGANLHTITRGQRTGVCLIRNQNAECQGLTTDANQLPALPGNEHQSHLKTLVQGDKIILFTDGLSTKIADPKELAVIDRYDNPTFAAKHLTSLAMGRDVQDNVSAGVINYGKKKVRNTKPLIAVGVIALVAIATTAILLLTAPKPVAKLPEDLGLAIPISGELYRVESESKARTEIENLSVISPGSILAVGEGQNVQLKLKTRGNDAVSTRNIPGVTVYISSNSVLRLDAIDYARIVDNEATPTELLNRSTFELLDGSMLVVNEGESRTYRIAITTEEGEYIYLVLLPAENGKGVAGAIKNGSTVELHCLAGSCAYSTTDTNLEIPILSKTVLDLGQELPSALELEKIPDEEWLMWKNLSGDSLE